MVVQERPVPSPLAARISSLGLLASELSRAFDQPGVLAAAGELIVDGCQLDQLTVALLQEGHDVLLASFDSSGATMGPPIVGPGHHLAVRSAALGGELIHGSTLARSPFPDLALLALAGLESAVVIPLRVRDRPIGALVAARRRNPFERQDLLALQAAAALTAAALELQHLTDIAQRAETERHKAAMLALRRADEITALETMANALERFELVHAVSVMATELASLRGIELCRITIVDPHQRLVEVAAGSCHGARFGPDDPARAADGLAVASGQPVLWRRPDASDTAARDGLARAGVTSLVALPLRHEDRVVGAIMAGSTGGHRLVTDEHVVVAELAGQLLVQAANGPDGLHRLLPRPGAGS